MVSIYFSNKGTIREAKLRGNYNHGDNLSFESSSCLYVQAAANHTQLLYCLPTQQLLHEVARRRKGSIRRQERADVRRIQFARLGAECLDEPLQRSVFDDAHLLEAPLQVCLSTVHHVGGLQRRGTQKNRCFSGIKKLPRVLFLIVRRINIKRFLKMCEKKLLLVIYILCDQNHADVFTKLHT